MDSMSKYSRKVHRWGALGDYTEHRDKSGRVSSRTRYHEGKAITTRAPREPAHTKLGYGGSSRSGGGDISGIFFVLVALIGLGAIGGAIFSTVSAALEDFWPIAGAVGTWVLVAAWAATVLHFARSTVERWDPSGVLFWLVTLAQLPLIAAGGFISYALISGLGEESTAQRDLIGAATGISILLILVLFVALIVLAFAYSWKWILLIPATLLSVVVLAAFGVADDSFLGIALVLYAAVMTRFSVDEY